MTIIAINSLTCPGCKKPKKAFQNECFRCRMKLTNISLTRLKSYASAGIISEEFAMVETKKQQDLLISLPPSPNTHKCVERGQIHVATNGTADLFEDSSNWLEVVGINEPGEARFSGTQAECEAWYEENHLSYLYP